MQLTKMDNVKMMYLRCKAKLFFPNDEDLFLNIKYINMHIRFLLQFITVI